MQKSNPIAHDIDFNLDISLSSHQYQRNLVLQNSKPSWLCNLKFGLGIWVIKINENKKNICKQINNCKNVLAFNL